MYFNFHMVEYKAFTKLLYFSNNDKFRAIYMKI